METKDREKLGWLFRVTAIETFKSFCDRIGGNYGENASAAMMLWPQLPPELREAMMLVAQGRIEMDTEFWEQFRAGYTMAQKALRNIHKEKRDE